MAVMPAVRTEQHDAEAVDSIDVVIGPALVDVQVDKRLDPPRSIQVWPLVGEAQMQLYDAAADGFEICHAGVAGEVFRRPGAAPVLDLGEGFAVHVPVVERAAGPGDAGGVA